MRCGGRSASCSPARRRERSRAPTRRARWASRTCSAATSAGPRPTCRWSGRAAVRQQHLRARARPHHQRALDRDLERRRGRREHRLDLADGRRARRAGERRRGPGPACYGRGGGEPTVTDACLLIGILDPDGFADGEIGLDVGAVARGVRGPGDAAGVESGSASPTDRGRQHRRGGHQRRDPSRRRPARLHADGLRRRGADAAAGGARPAARQRGDRAAPSRSLLGARAAQHGPRLLRQPSAYMLLDARFGARARRRCSPRWSASCASASTPTAPGCSCGAASTGACSARAGRRR